MTDWTKDSSWKRGQDVELGRFKRLMSVIDPNITEATLEEQYKHIDWHTRIGTVDVKAMKKISRSGSVQSEMIWIEFRNVIGRNGWVYGDQDWVAFEMPDGFIFVRTIQLSELASKLCNTSDMVSTAREALYRGYQRKGMRDVISMITVNDVKKIPHFTIKDTSPAPAIEADAEDSAFI